MTIFSPFATNVFHDSVVGNLIDSAIVVEDRDGTSAFNSNDNTPDLSSCKKLKDIFGTFDLAMINYNAAGPYPSCFRNLSEQEKIDEHFLVLKRNIRHLIACCDVLQPIAVLPFAGSYVIGGKEYQKNRYLGTTTCEYCADEIRSCSRHGAIALREGDTYDLLARTSDKPYQQINAVEQERYIADKLSKLNYPYESDLPIEKSELCEKLKIGSRAWREDVPI